MAIKNKHLFLLLLLSAWLCFGASCKKNNPNPNTDQLSLLPAATQIGANTFGCLVNGQAFLPQNNSFNGQAPYQCNYIFTNGGYNLTVQGTNDISSSPYAYQIILATVSLSIKQGQTLKLENYNENGKACALYQLISGTYIRYQTTTIVNGQLYISKLDSVKQIVSGTFSFSAINLTKGDTVHVTDGRFDMKYTQ